MLTRLLRKQQALCIGMPVSKGNRMSKEWCPSWKISGSWGPGSPGRTVPPFRSRGGPGPGRTVRPFRSRGWGCGGGPGPGPTPLPGGPTRGTACGERMGLGCPQSRHSAWPLPHCSGPVANLSPRPTSCGLGFLFPQKSMTGSRSYMP